MAANAESEIFAFITNQIGQIIVILLAIIGGFRWLDKRNEARVKESEIRLLGENKDGTGGIIGHLLSNANANNANLARNVRHIRERLTMLIKFLAGDVKRLDIAMEKIAQKSGVYYTRSQHDYEQTDEQIRRDEYRERPDNNNDNDKGLFNGE